MTTFEISRHRIINYERLKAGKRKKEFGHWEGAKWVWDLDEKHLVIFDEVHKCKNYKSQNGKILGAIS